jgi:hypothetical protein
VAGLVIVVGHASSTASAAVKLAGDGVCDVAELLLLLVKVLGGCLSSVVVEPVLGLLDSIENLFIVSVGWSIYVVLVNLRCPCHRRQSCHQDPPRR